MKDLRERKGTERLTVHRGGAPIYEIVLSEDFDALIQEARALQASRQRLCIVTDSTVAGLYLKELKERLAPCFAAVVPFVFPAGEANKNLDTVKRLYETLIENRFDRGDLLMALGGGVVGDLCGFAAATYLRGVSFIQVPTTLLSQVDSSIGGKTGVDFDAYKNMVGAFHMPKLVYINTGALGTLPDREFAAGMGEVLKHGLIKDKAYYEWLLEHAPAIRAKEPSILRQMAAESCLIKRAVVEADPMEQGERKLLNFGHTLGHAIEKLKDFELLHGECVALGSLAAMHISALRGYVMPEETERFRGVLALFGLPDRVSGLSKEDVIRATKNDKKMKSGVIQFILLKETGQAFVDQTVTDEEMAEGIDAVFAQGGTL